jgi:hypothetical protein
MRAVTAGSNCPTRDEVAHVVKEYAPPEPDEVYIAEYEAEGHTSEVGGRPPETIRIGIRLRGGFGAEPTIRLKKHLQPDGTQPLLRFLAALVGRGSRGGRLSSP